MSCSSQAINQEPTDSGHLHADSSRRGGRAKRHHRGACVDWKGKKAKINGLPLELQGFSHHPSFAGMGAMTNPRLGLFLAQTTKALGVRPALTYFVT